MRNFIVLVLFVIALVACNKTSTKDTAKKAVPSDKAAAEKAPAKKAAEDDKKGVGDAAVALTGLGLKGDAPGARVSKLGKSTMVQGVNVVATVKLASNIDPKDTAAARKEAADSYTGQDIKDEALSDGWLVSFKNKGSLGTNYMVWARREIDGKAYFCSSTSSKPEQQAGAITFCKSLRK